MVSRKDIEDFYKKYKKNLDAEAQVIDRLLQAEDQEIWLEKLRKKARSMRNLYIENEALLNLYVRPFLSGEVLLNDELADCFLHEIIDCRAEGYEDDLAFREVTELLNGYFRETKNRGGEIWCLNILGGLYNAGSGEGDGERSKAYFQQIVERKDLYFEIEDLGVRKRIIYAFYNHPVVSVNFRQVSCEVLLRILDEAMDFYNDPRVREKDGENLDFDELIDELNYDVLGNYICGSDRADVTDEFLIRGEKVLGALYEAELKKNPNRFEMPDEIYCNYHRCLFFLGKMSCTDFVEDYWAFCSYILENEPLGSQKGVEFYDSRVFQIATVHLTNILYVIVHYKDEYHGDREIWKKCADQYLNIIRNLPRTGNSAFVNDMVTRSLADFIELVDEGEVDFNLLMNATLNRDEETLLHSSMVGQIAARIMESVFANCPDLLLGSLDCQNVVEVFENREKIMTYVNEAAQVFDIGKIKIGEIINKQSRQLTERERKRIRKHCEDGYEITRKGKLLRKYGDVVLGHHKSYDGKMGYPADFDNTASPYRFFIELIHIADSMDAATDSLERSYKGGIRFQQFLDELEQGRGSLYSPELVDLLHSDQALQEDLTYLLSAGRNRIYYDIFGTLVREETKESEEEEAALPLLREFFCLDDIRNFLETAGKSQGASFALKDEKGLIWESGESGDGESFLEPISLHGKTIGQLQVKVKPDSTFSEEQRQSLAVLCRSLLTKEYENTCLVKKYESDFDERDDLLNMMQERGNENLGLIHALAEDFLLILYVNMRTGEYKVSHRNLGGCFRNLHSGYYDDFRKDVLAKAAWPEDWETIHGSLRLHEISRFFVKLGGIFETELRLETGEGYRWVRLRFTQLEEQNTIPSVMSVSFQDIHETKSRSEQMNEALKEAYHTAEGANRAKSLFLSSMSHDIRTPMNGIVGMTAIAMKNLDNRERVEDCLRKIDDSSRLLLSLINDVLDMSKIESGRMELSRQRISLKKLMNESAEVTATEARKKKQDFRVEIDLIHEYVQGDPVRLRQVFINLVSNAVKCTPEGGRIRMRLMEFPNKTGEECRYRFQVEDNGIGMSKEFLEKVFEPFTRADNSMTQKNQGTGLGLSITHSVVEMMGGVIEVKSEPGKGSIFTVILQFSAEEAPEKKEESGQEKKRPAASFEGFRALLAEDNELNREIAETFLEDFGIKAESVVNGQEAVELLKKRGDGYFDVVFMDIQMPVMNGYQATQAIRELHTPYTDQLPIIAMTANAFAEDVQEAFRAGMNEHVTKPVDVRKLALVLDKYLSRTDR